MPERIRFATLLAFALIVLGACRVYVVVAATPLLGYANQFDMRRTSACVGLWPDIGRDAQLQAHPEAPISRYVRGERRRFDCYWSSELLFVAPVAATLSPGETVDLRVIGAIKGTALVLVAIGLAMTLRRRPALALAHGAVFALVMCDPIVTLWLNTLYTEFSAMLFAYASVALVIAVGATPGVGGAPSRPRMAALVASLVGLGLSRQQHLLLPALLVAPLVVLLWNRANRSALILIAVACGVVFSQVAIVGRHPTIAMANNVDVILGTVLPASTDEARTAKRLNLPEHCLRAVGANWYVSMGEDLESICPEVLEAQRYRIATLAFAEPGTLWRAGLRAIPQLQDWKLASIGSVEGLRFGGSDAVLATAGALAQSIASFVVTLPLRTFVQMLAAAFGIFVVSAAVCLRAALAARSEPLALSLYALTGIALYAIATAVFGDGYVELARHAQLANVALYAAAVLLAMALVASLLAIFRSRRRRTAAPLLFTGLAIATALLTWVPMHIAMDAVPMAFGVIDRPARNNAVHGDVEFAGWAIDPEGVARVELVVDGSDTIPARYGLPYRGARGEPLGLYFPTYPDTASAGFVALLPADVLDRGVTDVRTVVINTTGMRTEIDRRRLSKDAR
jgi:Na+-translocating ferredoxin:NAD+ oxidoreductase RnfA subunit